MNDLPLNLDQETLVAYVDKELPPAQAAAVEAALMQNAAARETVRQLRQSAASAAHAFDAVLNEPVPDRLLLAAGAGAAAPRPRRPWPMRRLLPLAATLAALAIGLAAGYGLRLLQAEQGQGYVPAAAVVDPLNTAYESALLPALDEGAEGQAFTYAVSHAGAAADHGTIQLGRRFTAGFGAECREFLRQETRGGETQENAGLACRGPDRSWSVMLLPSKGP
jgi:anti-sigma factor RsiW